MSPTPAAWVMFASGETRPVELVAGDWACVREPMAERPVSVCVAGQTCRGILEQRATPEVCGETPKGRECVPCRAGELALHLGPESVPEMREDGREVRCPSGTVPLGGTPPMCQPAQEAPAAPAQPQPTVWNPGQDERWTAEFTAHGFIGLNQLGGAAGGDVAVGFRHLGRFNRKIPFDELGWAVIFVAPAAPFLLLPSGVWLGNEIGADLVVHGMAGFGTLPSKTSRLFFGLRPILRITTEEGRFRFPAVLGILPEVGMGVAQTGSAEFFLSAHPFTISYLVAPHLAIELDPVESLFVRLDSARLQGVIGLNLGFVAR